MRIDFAWRQGEVGEGGVKLLAKLRGQLVGQATAAASSPAPSPASSTASSAAPSQVETASNWSPGGVNLVAESAMSFAH